MTITSATVLEFSPSQNSSLVFFSYIEIITDTINFILLFHIWQSFQLALYYCFVSFTSFHLFKCCLGLQFKNPNIQAEMAQLIMDNQEKYVPCETNSEGEKKELAMHSGHSRMALRNMRDWKGFILKQQIGMLKLIYMR